MSYLPLITQLLSTEEYKASKRVSVYLSMKHEVRTECLLQDIFASGKTCFVPYYEANSTRMEMLRAHSMEDIASMPVTKWNISQPTCKQARLVLVTGSYVL